MYTWFDLRRKAVKGIKVYNRWAQMLATEYKYKHDELDVLVEAKSLARKICFLNRKFRETGFDQLLSRKYNVLNTPAPGSEKWISFTEDIYEVIDIFEKFYAGYDKYMQRSGHKDDENVEDDVLKFQYDTSG